MPALTPVWGTLGPGLWPSLDREYPGDRSLACTALCSEVSIRNDADHWLVVAVMYRDLTGAVRTGRRKGMRPWRGTGRLGTRRGCLASRQEDQPVRGSRAIWPGARGLEGLGTSLEHGGRPLLCPPRAFTQDRPQWVGFGRGVRGSVLPM